MGLAQTPFTLILLRKLLVWLEQDLGAVTLCCTLSLSLEEDLRDVWGGRGKCRRVWPLLPGSHSLRSHWCQGLGLPATGVSLTTSNGDMKEDSPQETQGHGSWMRERLRGGRHRTGCTAALHPVQMTALKPSTKSVVLSVVEKFISDLCQPQDKLKIIIKNSQLLPDNSSSKQWIKLVQAGTLNLTALDFSKWHMLLKEKPNEQAQNSWHYTVHCRYFLAYATVVTLCLVVPDINQVTAWKESSLRRSCSQSP